MSEVPKELFSLKETAEFLGVKAPTLRLKLRTGEWKIKEVRIGKLIKFHKADLDEFIESRKCDHSDFASNQ